MSVVYDAPGEKIDAIVEVPRDVEADVVAHFRANELPAQTEIDDERAPGMVRVTRTGGELSNFVQDVPQILIETWEKNSVASWALAQRAWALLALASARQQINGVELYDVDLGVPYTLDDDLAPELHRHQFLAVLTVPLTELTLSVEGAPS
ncbi:hypothetical protein CRM73_00140 [Kocuria sp. CCUG 69068]|uniref:hypothetical protein n=1 Tax=Kocuria sp. CCUG 69068 TaxID=2043138 RepID=UPI001E35ED1E|nr:hypothetical protein [Kocuria sp. CCUG 69068]